MKVEFPVVMLFSLAGNFSLWLAAFLSNSTLTPRFSKVKTTLCWVCFLALHYGLCVLGYSLDATNDTLNLISMLIIAPVAAVILYQEVIPARVFVSVMGALIANVATFFFCGTTLSFVDHSPNPYNIYSLLIFNSIKIVIFILLYLLYRRFMCKTVQDVITVLGEQMRKYVAIPVYSFLAFFVINRITNYLGILPAIPETRMLFILFYLIICSIFVILYWEIFSTALWSSRALRTEAELNVASNIQRDMLPNIFPTFPERDDFDIYATMEPAKEVGGDFYDFFMVDATHLAIVIADVSGKGVPAALFMVIAKTIIRNQAQSSSSPADIFIRANEQLCENNGEGLFVTAFLGIIDLETGVMTYANAGHNPPLLRHADGDYEWLKVRPGFVLAGMEGIRYRQFEVQLMPGSSVLLYTDGVTEATNAALELYGEARLSEAVNADMAKDMPPAELLPYIAGKVGEFVNGAEQADDITMLSFKLYQHSKPISKEALS